MYELGTKTHFLFKGVYGYRRFMKIAYDLTTYTKHPEVEEKIKILTFFDKYGLSTTKDAYSVGRSTIFWWKKKIKDGNGSLLGLINKSTKPYNTRRMFVEPQILEFIKSLREKYPRLGKEKIKILLDDHCRKNNIKNISISKVGKIIKRNNWYFYLGKRSKNSISIKRDRVFGYEVKDPGDLFQIDTVVRFEHGIKRYIVTAIDVISKFAFAYAYKTHSSRPAADFMQKLIKITPYPIKAIQTDNGSEFLKEFDHQARTNGIVHFFTYPRCPKQNGTIERFNRTIQDDFIDQHASYLEEPSPNNFNNLLIDHLLWYNTQRPHKTLGNIVPMAAVVEYLKKSNMYGTHTHICDT